MYDDIDHANIQIFTATAHNTFIITIAKHKLVSFLVFRILYITIKITDALTERLEYCNNSILVTSVNLLTHTKSFLLSR